VNISFNGKSITATVVDACATCSQDTHIDLSLPAAQALGMDQGNVMGDVTGATWKAVACPVTGNIVAQYNNGYTGQAYFQNVKYPVKSAVAGGHQGAQMFGYWDFGTPIAGQSVTLTDQAGHTATGTMPGAGGGAINGQFCP
jgi:expansin (peptidoglycan-binding protein)